MAAMQAALRSNPDLGQPEGRCRAGETGPAFLVDVTGLKDRRGVLKLEVYPPNEGEFLADDNILINARKTFRRAVVPVPATGTPRICIRVPAAGPYALSLLHDRDSDHKFELSVDGIGFSNNPRLGWGPPRAALVRVSAGLAPTVVAIRLNYRRGLLNIGPLEDANADR